MRHRKPRALPTPKKAQPTLTETEDLRVQNAMLRRTLVAQQMQALDAEVEGVLTAAMQRLSLTPGEWQYNLDTKEFVPRPEKPAPIPMPHASQA